MDKNVSQSWVTYEILVKIKWALVLNFYPALGCYLVIWKGSKKRQYKENIRITSNYFNKL